jgi:hypothetical protein
VDGVTRDTAESQATTFEVIGDLSRRARQGTQRMVHQVKLDGVPLPDTHKLSRHSSAEYPEGILDTIGHRQNRLLNL